MIGLEGGGWEQKLLLPMISLGVEGGIKKLILPTISLGVEGGIKKLILPMISLGVEGGIKKPSQVQDNLSHVTRKPVFRVCDQLRLKPACSVEETS